MKKLIIYFIALIIAGNLPEKCCSQQYQLKQATNIMGMRSESTIYVKGMRKRTEGGAIMGMGGNIVTIEQCDLQRYIKLNDKKKLYFIEPFPKGNEEVVEDDNVKDVAPPKTTKNPAQKGGVINMWYNITDTGERKKMYDITARHIWTFQKIKPSPDACAMKDSITIKTDGWYIDLPQFNCPVRYRPARMNRPNEKVQPDCMDRFVTHRRGSGRLGFPLTETTTMIMGGGNATEMTTSVETISFSKGNLDSMLFEIPPGYQLAASEEELQDKMDMKEMMKNAMKNIPAEVVNNEMKKPGTTRIGVFAPTGDDQVQPQLLQQQMTGRITSGNIEGIAVSSEDEARKFKCDYTLTTVFTSLKPAGNKLGGILKAIKNADPNAASSYNIEANLTLKTLSDGSVRSQPVVKGKYEGKLDDAAGKALEDGCREVLKGLK